MTSLDDLKARMKDDQPAGQPMLDLKTSEKISVSVAEIKAAVDACPCKDHCPCCKAFMKGIRGFNDDAKFILDKVDLQAVLEGCEVIHECNIVDGRKVHTKKLGPPHKSKPAPAPVKPAGK